MRQETNNEMDLLLRRLGRRQETSASSDHLDADELSLYAENILPPAARARYTEHLAECTRCRDLVVQLSSSAGVVAAQQITKVSEPSTLRKFLASLFAPMVLRYAVPAMGLVIVAAIGFIVLLNQGMSGNSPVAEVRDHQPAQAPATASQAQPSASPGEESRGLMDRQMPANKAELKDTAAETDPAAAPPAAAPVTTGEVQDTEAKKVERQQAATEEAPAPKSTPAPDELKKLEAEAQKRSAKTTDVANEPPAEKTKTQDRTGAGGATTLSPAGASRRAESKAESAGVGGVASRPMVVQRERDDTADKDKNDAELRTVAGRRFRKQGNVWIDTAYSSQNQIRLTRGSEQYRGLVADEPAIKQIADQLDGEIIVVWKGRAYRIQ